MLIGDVACYMMGLAFLDTSTALPKLVLSLGEDAPFLGLILALRQGASFLAPVLIAHSLQGLTLFKPTLVRVCFWGRILLLPSAAFIYFYGDHYPFLALCGLGIAMIAAWLGDGFGMVPWTALVGKMIPARKRGRLFATTQIVSGVGRLFISGAVAALLSGRLIAFPHNMGILVLCCAISLGASWGFIASFREPPPAETTSEEKPSLGFVAYLRSVPVQMREHPTFALLATVQIFLTATGACMPFVIGYAESVGTHLPTQIPPGLSILGTLSRGGLTGLFLAAQTAGMLLLAPGWGWVNDRFGPKTAVTGLFAMAALCPLLSLIGGLSGGNLLFFLLAYLCYGAATDWWIPVTNYLIESVPAEKQATFLGLMNATAAPALLLPLLAGFLIRSAGGPTLLIETLFLLIVGLLLALRLPATRHRA
jgi:MFS family permease